MVPAAFLYPLVLKCLLSQHGLYSLTLEDVAWTLGLEKLLGDRPFFEASPEPVDEEEPEVATSPDALAMREALQHRMTRWERQFDGINNALLGIELSSTIREVLDKYEAGASGNDTQK